MFLDENLHFHLIENRNIELQARYWIGAFLRKTKSFELLSPPSTAHPRMHPIMHLNCLNVVSQCFYALGDNGFPSAAELFPPSPCVCPYKSSSSTQHSKYLSTCHFLFLIRRVPECLSHFTLEKKAVLVLT